KDRDVLFQFCRPLIQHSLVRVARGKFVNAPVKTFAAATKDRKEFRFHINQLDDLKLMLRNYGHGEDKLTVGKSSLLRRWSLSPRRCRRRATIRWTLSTMSWRRISTPRAKRSRRRL